MGETIRLEATLFIMQIHIDLDGSRSRWSFAPLRPALGSGFSRPVLLIEGAFGHRIPKRSTYWHDCSKDLTQVRNRTRC